MKDNLPKKYKESFFIKFINKIKNFFFKNKDIECNVEDYVDNTNENNFINYNGNYIFENDKKVNFDNSSNYNIRNERKKFLKSLIERPELLEHFSNDKLEVILEEYQKENEIKKAKLKKYGENI